MICIPITAISQKEALHDIERGCLIADAVELRMDMIADGCLEELVLAVRRSPHPVKIIVTWRRKEEAAPETVLCPREEIIGQKEKKVALLKEAIDLGADYIDIELAEGSETIEGLKAYCEAQGGITQIIVSYHNFKMTPCLNRLKEVFRRCREYKPAVVKIVTYAGKPEDNLRVLSLIPYARKNLQNIIALCMGDGGRISRTMASFFGNYLDFATLRQGAQSAPGQLTVSAMRQINKLINSDEKERIHPVLPENDGQLRNYILMGNPVAQSLSPLMHNTALHHLGIKGHYNAFCVSDLAAAVQGIRGMDIHGVSVTIPFKAAVMEYLDNIDDDALSIGAVNTICVCNGHLTGFNTDWLGLLGTLEEAMTIKGKQFVIIGAGGTARAAAYGIMKNGGNPVIVNRSERNGKLLAGSLGCPFYELGQIGKIKADCLINTTPVGMYPASDVSPIDTAVLAGYKYVMDVIYNPLKTKLLKDAEQLGCCVLTGLNMFVHQGAEQIKLWTGKEPNRRLMNKVVTERLIQVE